MTTDPEAGSIRSYWSSSLQAYFPRLRSTTPMPTSQAHVEEGIEDKLQDIRACLDNDADEVDLWHLRELALKKAGLVSTQVRKQAWPKLVGAHDQALQKQHATTHLTPLSARDTELLQQDLDHHSVWNIEEQVAKNRSPKRVTFVPELTAVTPTASMNQLAQTPTTSTPTSTTICSPPRPKSVTVFDTSSTTTSLDDNATQFSKSSITTSPQEQHVVRGTLLNVFRTAPVPYHYYPGLHDLTAVMLINLESPSLTAILLSKLASSSSSVIRDALLRKDWKEQVHFSVFQLLQRADVKLYEKLQPLLLSKDCMETLGQWAQTWFTSVLPDIAVASRLVDVFLVSHATMPIYVSVAFVCRYRNYILEADNDEDSLFKCLASMPECLLEDEHSAAVAVQDVIDVALQQISRHPPNTLVDTTTSCDDTSMWQEPPDWAVAPTAPTDWALLQRSKALREHDASDVKTLVERYDVSQQHSTNYPLPMAAMGIVPTSSLETKKKTTRKGWILGAILLLVLVVLVTTGGASSSSWKELLPKEHAPAEHAPAIPKRRVMKQSHKRFIAAQEGPKVKASETIRAPAPQETKKPRKLQKLVQKIVSPKNKDTKKKWWKRILSRRNKKTKDGEPKKSWLEKLVVESEQYDWDNLYLI